MKCRWRNILRCSAWPSGWKKSICPNRDDPIRLDEHSEALRLIQRVRDEAHRFAITHHRGLRTRRSVASRLEEIPGIGATRRPRAADALCQSGRNEAGDAGGTPGCSGMTSRG